MDFNISNTSVADRVETCLDEFNKITSIIDGMGHLSHPVPFLTRYSIIRACGAIEYGFKTIISDINSDGQPEHIRNFIDIKFRNSSMNPSFDNIVKSLKGFNCAWAEKFKAEVNNYEEKDRIKSSLKSLNEARNSFAHGGSPTATFSNIKDYFIDSIKILESLEKAIT